MRNSLYWLFVFSIYVLALPILCLLCLKKKYRKSVPARFFGCQKSISKDTQIWFHACSFGEVKSLMPFLNLLKDQKILITTTTQTGYELAKEISQNQTPQKEGRIEVRYLPFEIFLCFLNIKHLKALIVLEAELWQGIFLRAKAVGASTWLINARISNRSYHRYLKFSFYYKKVFSHIDHVLSQTESDAIRLEKIGAKNIRVFGNLKIFTPIQATTLYKKPKKLLLLAASTHAGEEKLILSIFLRLLQNEWKEKALLILAPRHPERFEEVASLLKQKDIFISKVGIPDNAEILVLDKLGVLNSFYKIADIVILGGSFFPIGGHNPLEPAFFHAKLITGKHTFNQLALFEWIQNYYVANDPEDLYPLLNNHKNLKKSLLKPHNNNLEDLVEEIKNYTPIPQSKKSCHA